MTWNATPLLVNLSQFTRACAYDRAGVGYSGPTDKPLREVNVTERLRKLLHTVMIEDDLVLVGWSTGGVYVREFYRQYPERVAAMFSSIPAMNNLRS